jgi:small GTP-binding protein
MAQLNYGFLLLVHLICADKQIHSEELKYLQELGDRANISQQTKDEIDKIFAQDDYHLTVDDIAKQVSVGEQSEIMRQILAMAHVDGHYASLEKDLINKIGKIWNWSKEEIDWHRQYAEKFAESRKAKVKQEALLIGEDYTYAVEKCNKIAQEDYQYAELAFKKTESTLKTLILSLGEVMLRIENKNSNATTAKEVANQLEESSKYLDAEIIKELNKVQESHQAKQRALSYFTIAFMGRTKAGKSTLHSIITQDGWESIGVGKQRTTRLNRIYEWKNIRIIDTPGIGAADAGGRNDEDVAKSIVDEADVICYVVTNDSIQETEFKFLEQLKEKAKPLIIILNLKYNLRDSRRLQHFLENPNKLFAKDGESGIAGHIDRIRRHVSNNYNDYFDIVPVMLLAAQLSSEAEHQENKNKLYKASRIQDFLDSIRESLIKHGAIRRSQTFLGSTVGSILKPDQWITEQKERYQKSSNTLKSKQEKICNDLIKAQKDSCEYLEQQIEATFQDVINVIPAFAENHWEANEHKLNRAWKEKIKDIKLEERLQLSNEQAVNKFNQEIKELLEEVGKELQLISQIGIDGFNLNSQDSFDEQKLFKIGGSIIGLLGVGLMFFPPLAGIGIAVSLLGTGLNWISDWFTSKAEKRRIAVKKISKRIREQINKQKYSIAEKAHQNFETYCRDVLLNINSYFHELIEGLDDISNRLEKAQNSLDATINYLNSGYAKRIIDWSTEQYEALTVESTKKVIAKVNREFGQKITIQIKTEIELKKSLEEIKQVIQEDISIKVG